MEDYYRKRILEYEKIYYRDDTIRLKEQEKIADAIKRFLKNKAVIEVAAGTGYWSEILSESASKIMITDLVSETLGLAKTKKYKCPVEFKKEDAYSLSFQDNTFSGGMANLWFSHIPKERINDFFNEFHRVLKNGAIVFMSDNNFDGKVGGKIIKPTGDFNTYKIRRLNDGSKHKILKNYYYKEELFNIFSKFSHSFSGKNIFYGQKFWYVYYKLNKSKS